MPYKQQGVVQLRPSDMIRVVQNVADKLLLIQSVIDAIKAMADEMVQARTEIVNAQFTTIDNEITTILNLLNSAPPIGKYVDGTVNPVVVYTGTYQATVKATVSGGNAVFQFTDNGLAGGNALFPNLQLLQSLQLRAEEGVNPHAYGTPVLSNGGKTVTVPINRTGATLSVLGLTVLGQNVAANGSVIYATMTGK